MFKCEINFFRSCSQAGSGGDPNRKESSERSMKCADVVQKAPPPRPSNEPRLHTLLHPAMITEAASPFAGF